MDSSHRSPLTPIQVELLRALFPREGGFYLSGGAALAGFFLHHRPTDDLDLFTADRREVELGKGMLRDAAERIGASVEIRQESPGFLRGFVARGAEAVVVDLIHEPVAQRVPRKPRIEGIPVDPPEEILANKLAALAGRTETRDLVDLAFLERAGFRVEDALEAALAKDGGATPAAIAWSVTQIELSDGSALPGGLSPRELRDYRDELVRRLRAAAFPRA